MREVLEVGVEFIEFVSFDEVLALLEPISSLHVVISQNVI